MAVIPAAALGIPQAALALVMLETLPCGCITAVYRASPTVVEVDVVEAKGPHCRFFGHRAGQVMRLAYLIPRASKVANRASDGPSWASSALRRAEAIPYNRILDVCMRS